ncbi:hypothetical protein [Roseovarius ramblicola]|uniref:Alpha/beta hydrolase family protein n=1 Tax=Roseovarius ramblicola TaxID=2022336 RepID=A0ABV5I4J0_9RHOB
MTAVPGGAEPDGTSIPYCGENGTQVPAASDVTAAAADHGTVRLDRADGIDPFRWLAHGVFQDRARDQLDNGYVISLEKLPAHVRLSGQQHQTPILRRYAEVPGGPPAHVAAKRDRWLKRMFDDPKLQVATHVTRYDDGTACGLMNPYHDAGNPMPLCKPGGTVPDKTTFRAGIDGLFQTFLPDLTARLRDGDYTHIVFASMGWNNDQRVSICRYRRIMDQTARAMPGDSFRPLVVGMTWSSSWWPASSSRFVKALGHIGSVFNKATDSDEAGVLHGNVILNRLIPHANRAGLPVVVLGHSFGARLSGRALFSRDLLRLGPEGPPADLAVFLQPAHSVFRYGGDTFGARGNEGHPFDSFRTMPETRVVVTTSPEDTANPLAIWSPYMGSDQGWRVAGRRVFHDLIHRVPDSGVPSVDEMAEWPPGKVTLVKAGFVGGHGDILNPEVAQFLARLITAHASR